MFVEKGIKRNSFESLFLIGVITFMQPHQCSIFSLVSSFAWTKRGAPLVALIFLSGVNAFMQPHQCSIFSLVLYNDF
jgi:hypothetical protein